MTWYRCDGDVTRTAAALYCHRNTVFNRSRRLQDLTGRSLDTPLDITRIVLAADALRLTSNAPRSECTGWPEPPPQRGSGHPP